MNCTLVGKFGGDMEVLGIRVRKLRSMRALKRSEARPLIDPLRRISLQSDQFNCDLCWFFGSISHVSVSFPKFLGPKCVYCWEDAYLTWLCSPVRWKLSQSDLFTKGYDRIEWKSTPHSTV